VSEDLDVGELLAEQLERLFSREIGRALRQSVEERHEVPARLWSEVEALGVTVALASESSGGAGLSWARAEPILRKLGEYAAPLPLGETLLGVWALDAAGLEPPPGPIAIATAELTLVADGRVSGVDVLVPWPEMARSVLVTARGNGELRLCLIDAIDAVWSRQNTHARIPSATLRLESVKPLRSAAVPAILGELGLLPAVATLRSVEIAGLLDHILTLCVEYANTREQFGKPIGRFQAIQHLLAELAGHVAAAQVAGLYGCRQIDALAGARGAAIAKIRAGMSATQGAAIAHQVFGAIGVTAEHELHYYTRRLWQWRGEGGSEHSWSERLGRAVLEAGGAALWPSVTNQ
jgi:acyl-CoA dehydrogenase